MKRSIFALLATISTLLQPWTVMALPDDELSRTAIIAAMFRAIGETNPEPQFRNPDTLARGFLGPRERKSIAGFPMAALLDMEYDSALAQHRQATGRNESPMAAHFVRTVRIDELLIQAVADGAVQVVILGAGFDSRAYRLREELSGARVFEVDHPLTQANKIDKVGALVEVTPSNVIYVPIDFNTQNLQTELARAGYQAQHRTFFVWEGVTYYLPRDAISSTLRFIGEHAAPGSEVVFDYTVEEAITGEHNDDRLHQLRTSALRFEEPWLFGAAPESIADLLVQNGLRVVTDLGEEELERQYLTRDDGELVDGYPWWWRICHAVVIAE